MSCQGHLLTRSDALEIVRACSHEDNMHLTRGTTDNSNNRVLTNDSINIVTGWDEGLAEYPMQSSTFAKA